MLFVPFLFPYIAFISMFLTPWIVQVSRLAWSRGHFFGLGLGLTVIGLGLASVLRSTGLDFIWFVSRSQISHIHLLTAFCVLLILISGHY